MITKQRFIPQWLWPNALIPRLIRTLSISLVLFLGLLGYALENAYRHSLLIAKQEQLQLQMYLLLADAELTEPNLTLPDTLQLERLNALNSGLYAFIYRSTGEYLWQSPSVKQLPTQRWQNVYQPQSLGDVTFDQLPAAQGALFRLRYSVSWEGQQEYPFQFILLEDPATFHAQLHSYRQNIWLWFACIALVIICLQIWLLRWGLSPLKRLALQIQQLEQGERQQLQDNYPAELHGVTQNLNQLINTEQQQRERYRHTLDDLAHSLKTPLAVLHNALHGSEPQDLALLQQQSDRMQQIVNHQLKRAVLSYQHQLIEPIAVAPIVQRICNSLAKLYQADAKQCDIQLADDLMFKGDEQDLFEILGNVIENAFKYSQHWVAISAQPHTTQLHLSIEDDGPGIAPELQQRLVQRGQRADTQHSGQGIGLTVVHDIVQHYGGTLQIGVSRRGGCRIDLCFNTIQNT